MKPTRPSIDPRRHCLRYTAPVHRWDEGLPLGNGLLGLLVWGDGHPLNLSVDRSDLWDNRPDPKTKRPEFNWKYLTELVDRGEMEEVYRIFEHSAEATIHPTKLPCGRLQLDFGRAGVGRNRNAFSSHLDFATAISTTSLGGSRLTAYVHAVEPLLVVRVRGARPRVNFLSAFDRARQETGDMSKDQGGANVFKLGYPPLQRGMREGVEFILQRCADGFSFTVAWITVSTAKEWLLYLTVQIATDNRDPLAATIAVLQEAKATGPARLEKAHLNWWHTYWRKGHVRLPDPRIEHLWYAEMYKLGACARENTPPISLQGVWTADEQNIPPWRGDYHHDLNTQMSYWPVHTAGRREQSRGFARWLHSLLPKYREFAHTFYGAPGANVPCSHGLTGEIVPGWAAYVYSRGNAPWLVQHLWWHWRYTLDKDFLRDIAYPFIREVARFAMSQLIPDEKGVYHIHHSSSPEYNHNWRTSFATDSTYDLANIRYALGVARAAAEILGVDAPDAKEWERVRAKLQPYPFSPTRANWPAPECGLAIWQGQRLDESHRHPAQCMPIFPLGDLNVEGSDGDREVIQNTLSEIECMGTGFWCGYSFSWYACIGARIREPNRVLWGLNSYLDGFVSPNTFHLNGDYKKLGSSRFHYRPFTLEGNLGAGHAVNEMLLQSWGDRIRLFPAVPPDWNDVAFTDLHAEGAFGVSAWRHKGEFVLAEVSSEKGSSLRIEHPHPSRVIVAREVGGGFKQAFRPPKDISFRTKAGRRYLLTAE